MQFQSHDPWLWRMRPRALMPGVALGPVDDLTIGQAKEYLFGRGTTVFSMFVVRQGSITAHSSSIRRSLTAGMSRIGWPIWTRAKRPR